MATRKIPVVQKRKEKKCQYKTVKLFLDCWQLTKKAEVNRKLWWKVKLGVFYKLSLALSFSLSTFFVFSSLWKGSLTIEKGLYQQKKKISSWIDSVVNLCVTHATKRFVESKSYSLTKREARIFIACILFLWFLRFMGHEWMPKTLTLHTPVIFVLFFRFLLFLRIESELKNEPLQVRFPVESASYRSKNVLIHGK